MQTLLSRIKRGKGEIKAATAVQQKTEIKAKNCKEVTTHFIPAPIFIILPYLVTIWTFTKDDIKALSAGRKTL